MRNWPITRPLSTTRTFGIDGAPATVIGLFCAGSIALGRLSLWLFLAALLVERFCSTIGLPFITKTWPIFWQHPVRSTVFQAHELFHP